MTIDQFRQSELLSAELADLLKHPTLAMAMQIADAVSPSNGGVKEWTLPHMAHIQLGVDRGYNMYAQVLRIMATPVSKPQAMPEPEYAEVEEKE